MPDESLREPEQIRQDCAQKLRPVETGGILTAILGYLLREDWSTPRIEELQISPNRCLLARLPIEAESTGRRVMSPESDSASGPSHLFWRRGCFLGSDDLAVRRLA